MSLMEICRYKLTPILLLACVPLFVNAQSQSSDLLQKAQDHVELLHATLLQAMQTPDHEQRETLLKPVLNVVFDVQNIARISIGRTWRKLSAADQELLVQQLEQLVVATYADRFDSYNGQQFSNGDAEVARSGQLVKSTMTRADGSEVSLDYYLRGGLIFNVVADGVSDLSLRRADYSSIIKNQGYEQLLKHIQQKIEVARRGS